MPLHVEQLAVDLIAHMRANYAAALGNLYNEHDAQLPLTAPPLESYFVGEPSRVRAYEAPAVFVDPVRSRNGDSAGRGMNVTLYQEHDVALTVVVEATQEEDLTRLCWRHAQAVQAMLHVYSFTPAAISNRRMDAYVNSVEYGTSFTRVHDDQRTFRKDVTLATLVKHWDQYTELPIQLGSGAQIVNVVGQANTGGVVTSLSDTALSTTNATTVATYAPATAGNFAVYLYFRVTTSTTLTVTVAWTDGTGAQTAVASSGTHGTGSFAVKPFFLNSVGASAITVTATAGTADAAVVSASIETLT